METTTVLKSDVKLLIRIHKNGIKYLRTRLDSGPVSTDPDLDKIFKDAMKIQLAAECNKLNALKEYLGTIS
jgi:hypothetical protein